MIADKVFLMKKTELRNCRKDPKLRKMIGTQHIDELVTFLGERTCRKDAQLLLGREIVEKENG